MTFIEFFVAGTPQGKGRARTVRLKNGAISSFTPEKTRTYEGIIRTVAMEALKGAAPSAEPLLMKLDIKMPIPESWPEWKREAAMDQRIAPTTKPDADNTIKAFADALNGVAFVDDSQITTMYVSKFYSDRPGVRVTLMSDDKVPAQITKRCELEEAYAATV